MIRNTNATELLLEGLEQGHRYGLVITGALSAVALEFRHLDDPTWYAFPGADMTASAGGVISVDFFCVAPVMRLRLAAAQETNYRVSAICAATATF